MAESNNCKELLKRSSRLFDKKAPLDSFWQECALNFYPERASFTTELSWGTEFATHLFDGSPVLMRRDLGNAFSAYLRPRGQPWFKHDLPEWIKDRKGVKPLLDETTNIHRAMLYEAKSQFVRATKETDHDYAAFGNGVLSCEPRDDLRGICFHNHFLGSCAWTDNADGVTDTMFRDMMMSARQIMQRWPKGKIHDTVRRAAEKEPDKEFKVRHAMLPIKDYEYEDRKNVPKGAEFASCYIDVSNTQMISEAGSFEFRYIVPRWQTIPGSPYAVSPAATIALPDARMMQTLARIIQEAGEKSVDPPVKATEKAIRGEVNLYASGITWIDRDYDEKLGAAIEPIAPFQNPGLGVDLLVRTGMLLKEAWYLNKLTLPQQGEKTAYETSQLIEEFIRSSIPLFEPVETTYNTPLLNLSFRQAMRLGAFPEFDPATEKYLKENITFAFDNPLQNAIEKAKVYAFQTAMQVTSAAVVLDPAAANDLDVRTSMRDAITGSGAPAAWLRDKEKADEMAAQQAQAAAVQQTVGTVEQVGAAAESVGKGGQAVDAAIGNTEMKKAA